MPERAMFPKGILKEFRRARSRSNFRNILFRDSWRYYGSEAFNYPTYNFSFPYLLQSEIKRRELTAEFSESKNELKTIVEAVRRSNGEVSVLDLMGYGSVSRDLHTRGVALAKRDKRSAEDKNIDDLEQRTLVEGDILSPLSWNKIQSEVRDNAKFNIIVCRPQGAITYVPRNPYAYGFILRNAYRLLSENDGIFLSQIHWRMRKFVKRACEELNKIPGIEAKMHGAAFMLVKHTNSPEKLPILQ